VNNSLPNVPLLEEISLILLRSWSNLLEFDHTIHKLSLPEYLVDHEIVFLMNCSVTSLARNLENLESSSQSSRVISVPGLLGRPVAVTVMHTNRVNLFFITLDSIRCSNIISEEPSISLFMAGECRILSEAILD